jgi:hypothetical protein
MNKEKILINNKINYFNKIYLSKIKIKKNKIINKKIKINLITIYF